MQNLALSALAANCLLAVISLVVPGKRIVKMLNMMAVLQPPQKTNWYQKKQIVEIWYVKYGGGLTRWRFGKK